MGDQIINIKQIVTAGVTGVALGAMDLDKVEVTGVMARQRYPWNRLVDVAFTITGERGIPRNYIDGVSRAFWYASEVRRRCEDAMFRGVPEFAHYFWNGTATVECLKINLKLMNG